MGEEPCDRRYSQRPPEELYDLEADPWELRNLASEPARAATLARLRAHLDAWMNERGNEGLATERALHDPRTDEGETQ
jgi:arylsulfatase A-like enzyme